MFYRWSSNLTLSETSNFRIFEFDENGGKFYKRVEDTVESGEMARYEQFLLFPHCVFKTLVLQTRKIQGLFGKGLSLYLIHLIKG